MEKFCDIATRNEFADFLRIPRKKLTHILYIENPNDCYRTFEIPKKSGGTRVISAPNDDLKQIQQILANAIYQYQKSIWAENKIKPNISHAFEKKKSIITNAQIHRNKRYVLNIDLRDFFDSFHFGRVCGYFEKNRYFEFPHEIAVIISQLACCNGKLPQGAPTSPIITNLMCQILDMKILRLAKQYKLDYTRYADDLTFSTNNKMFLEIQAEFMQKLTDIIVKEGFLINESKTRLQYRDSKQVVTGLIVNKKINVDRSYYRDTRAMANHLYKQGEFEINNIPSTINQLEGRFSFINQLDKYNNSIDSVKKHNFRELNGREKQYQMFLFYKYFFANNKPLIITEGKTDVLYIKAALKNLYLDYPELIEKNKDGTFTYKISFLKRTKRLEYFFGFVLDGADAMKNLTRYFKDCKEKYYTNYLKYFKELSGNSPLNPVILVFDNELSNKEKPLKKFSNDFISETNRTKLKKDLVISLIDDSNLFLITNQLVNGKDECEIEDLFDVKTRSIEIEGKTLSLKGDYDTNKHFGKEIFSKYVFNNYQSIDFSNFKTILDNIKKLVNKS